MTDFVSSGAATNKAGYYMPTTIPELAWCEWASNAMAYVQAEAREDYQTGFATLDAQTKAYIMDAGNSLMAIEAIKHDMSSYPSRGEAQDLINVLADKVNKIISRLRDKKTGKSMIKG